MCMYVFVRVRGWARKQKKEWEIEGERERMRDREKERAAGSKHRFLAEGIDFRRREIAWIVAALGPLAES